MSVDLTNLYISVVTPHCSFRVPDTGEGCRPRESIETRTVVALPM